MKKALKYLAFLAPGLFALTGCEDPKVEETLPYYYTESIVYLHQSTSSFTFAHTPSGIKNEDIPFTIKLNMASENDCSLSLELESEGIDASNISFVDGSTLTIPAGAQSVSSALHIDWDAATDDQIDGTVKLTIKSADLRIAQEKNVMEVAVCKLTKTNVYQPSTDYPAGSSLDNRSEWTVRATVDPTFAGELAENTTVTDNNTSTYIWYGYSKGAGIEIDLKTSHKITGIRSFSSFGSYYAPTSVTIFTSMDGENWTVQGKDIQLSAAATTNIEFYEPVTAQYLRLGFDATMYGVLSAELYVYTE